MLNVAVAGKVPAISIDHLQRFEFTESIRDICDDFIKVVHDVECADIDGNILSSAPDVLIGDDDGVDIVEIFLVNVEMEGARLGR